MLDFQLFHHFVRLLPLPVVFTVAIISELRTERTSMLVFASADPDERREELCTDEDGVSRAEGGSPSLTCST